VICGFFIGERYCILYALGNKKDNLAEFNLADFRNSPNRQNKFYAKFSSYTVSVFDLQLQHSKLLLQYCTFLAKLL